MRAFCLHDIPGIDTAVLARFDMKHVLVHTKLDLSSIVYCIGGFCGPAPEAAALQVMLVSGHLEEGCAAQQQWPDGTKLLPNNKRTRKSPNINCAKAIKMRM